LARSTFLGDSAAKLKDQFRLPNQAEFVPGLALDDARVRLCPLDFRSLNIAR
jgi:hypothetical protein